MNKKKDDAKEKKQSNQLAQPHDATFKKLFGEKEIARDVIEKNLPKEVLDQLDMNSLEKLDGSFINEKLEETFTDILYGVKINGSDAYLALLLEHKSYADKLGIFQVAGYVIDAWRKMIADNKKELPVIVPIIIYHGKANWNYEKDIRDMIPEFETLPEYLKQMLPVIRHEFINIGTHTEEDMMEYDPLTRMVLRSFKYIYYDKETLVEMFIISVDEIQSVVSDEVFNKIINTLLLYYSSANKEISEEEIVKKVQELDGKGSKVMTILERREQRGIEKGIEQGKIEMVKELIKEGSETEFIVKVSKLNRDEIEEIRKEMLN